MTIIDPTQFGRALEAIENIEKHTACLPAVCEQQARHDERITELEKKEDKLSTRMWAVLAIVITAAVGLLAKAAGAVDAVCDYLARTGGK
jgi:hypothetical protein